MVRNGFRNHPQYQQTRGQVTGRVDGQTAMYGTWVRHCQGSKCVAAFLFNIVLWFLCVARCWASTPKFGNRQMCCRKKKVRDCDGGWFFVCRLPTFRRPLGPICFFPSQADPSPAPCGAARKPLPARGTLPPLSPCQAVEKFHPPPPQTWDLKGTTFKNEERKRGRSFHGSWEKKCLPKWEHCSLKICCGFLS